MGALSRVVRWISLLATAFSIATPSLTTLTGSTSMAPFSSTHVICQSPTSPVGSNLLQLAVFSDQPSVQYKKGRAKSLPPASSAEHQRLACHEFYHALRQQNLSAEKAYQVQKIFSDCRDA